MYNKFSFIYVGQVYLEKLFSLPLQPNMFLKEHLGAKKFKATYTTKPTLS